MDLSNSVSNEAEKFLFMKRDLYGGAIEMTIPKRFMDVSQVREVPNNQEVFADVDTDQSVIVELLSLADIPHEESIKTIFQDLSNDNDALGTQVFHVGQLTVQDLPSFGENIPKYSLIGQQQVAKFHEQATNTVNIYMALIRLVDKTTDLVVTFNDPILISTASSSAKTSSSSLDPALNVELFKSILKTLQIKDMSILDG